MADSQPKLGVWLRLGVVVVLAAGGALFLYLRTASTSEVTGTLTLDEVSFAPLACRSGKVGRNPPANHPRFDGVDLLGPNGRVVRVIDDPSQGRSVLVIDGDAAPRRIDRAACDRYEVQLRDTGELIMEVWGMEGAIDLDCPEARGAIRFESCFSGR